MTTTLDNSRSTLPTPEQIDAAKPLISWISPAKASTILRYLVRRGWTIIADEPALAYNDGFPARGAQVMIVNTATGLPHDPKTDAVRVWGYGLVVVTGTNKAATMDLIAMLRASHTGEQEDATNGGPDRDSRLSNAPGWLRNR
jgi:hypothetical protein